MAMQVAVPSGSFADRVSYLLNKIKQNRGVTIDVPGVTAPAGTPQGAIKLKSATGGEVPSSEPTPQPAPSPTPPPSYNQPSQPSASDQAGNVAGNVGGSAAGYYAGSQLAGGGAPAVAPAVTPAVTPAMAPAAVEAVAPAAAPAGGGVGAFAVPATALAIGLNNFWESGGKRVLTGGANKADYLNSTLAFSPLAPTQMGMRLLGMDSIGKRVFGGGKSQDQQKRDSVRSVLKEGGVVDENWDLTLADGTKFNIGKDGGATITGSDGQLISPHAADQKNPLGHQAVGWANPLAAIATGGDKELTSAFAGYFSNAALSNATTMEGVRANLLAIMDKMNITKEDSFKLIDEMVKAGKIDEQTGLAYKNGLNTLIDGNPETYQAGSMEEHMPKPETTPPPGSTTVSSPGATTPPPQAPSGASALYLKRI